MKVLHDHLTLIDAQAVGHSRWEISKNLGHCGGGVDDERVVEAIIKAELNQC